MMGGVLDQMGGKIISIVGVALVAALLVQVLSMTKSANIPQELLFMTMRIQQLYASSSDYSTIDNATVINAGVVPKSLIKGTAIKHEFNGNVTIAPGSANETFTFTLDNIPKEECVTLANNRINSWVSVAVNGTQVGSDVSAITSACTEKSVLTFEAQ